MTAPVIVELHNLVCIQCGTPFALPKALDQQRRADGRSFSCPNGHPQSYVVGPNEQEQEIERLREVLRAVNEKRSSLWSDLNTLRREFRRCPICGIATGRSNDPEKIKLRLLAHLIETHGARREVRALPAGSEVSQAS